MPVSGETPKATPRRWRTDHRRTVASAIGLPSLTATIVSVMSAISAITVLPGLSGDPGKHVARGRRDPVPFLANWKISAAYFRTGLPDRLVKRSRPAKRSKPASGASCQPGDEARPVLFAAPIVIIMILLIIPVGKRSRDQREAALPPTSPAPAQRSFDKPFPGSAII